MKKIKSAQETLSDLKRNAEKSKDIRMLYELLPGLSDEGVIAIYFRFWECLLINDIARILGRSWDHTDKLIEQSIKDLRGGFSKIRKNISQPQAA